MLLSDERAVIHAIGVDGTIRFQVVIINFYTIHVNYHVDRSKTDADNVDRHANRVEFGVISTNFHEFNVNQHSDNSKRIAYHSKHNAIAVFILSVNGILLSHGVIDYPFSVTYHSYGGENMKIGSDFYKIGVRRANFQSEKMAGCGERTADNIEFKTLAVQRSVKFIHQSQSKLP